MRKCLTILIKNFYIQVQCTLIINLKLFILNILFNFEKFKLIFLINK